MTPFKELIPGMEYEIDIGVNQYRGTFKNRVDNLAYFDPLYVTKKYVPTPMMDWEKAVKALGITPEIAMKRYKTDETFFYVGACCLTRNGDRSFLRYMDARDIDPLYFLNYWEQFEISDLYDPYQFVFEWWSGNIDPSTLTPPKGMKHRVLSQKVQSLGQYFHDQRLFKKIETP
jgi:hypothetical protein